MIHLGPLYQAILEEGEEKGVQTSQRRIAQKMLQSGLAKREVYQAEVPLTETQAILAIPLPATASLQLNQIYG